MQAQKKILLGIAAYSAVLVTIAAFMEDISKFDIWAFSIIMGFQKPYLEPLMVVFTSFGSSLFWLIATLAFWLKGKKNISLQLACAFIIDSVLSAILKFTFMSPRPFNVLDLGFSLDSLGPSLPSGHAERAFSGAFILSRHYRKYSVALFSLSALTALSRVYMGLHFPTDILIGTINGLIVGYISMRLPTKQRKKH